MKKNEVASPIQTKLKVLLSRHECADAMGISLRSVDYLLADGRLTHRRVGCRVLIPFQAMVAFIAENNPTAIVTKKQIQWQTADSCSIVALEEPRQHSPETRQKMSTAQKRRWDRLNEAFIAPVRKVSNA